MDRGILKPLKSTQKELKRELIVGGFKICRGILFKEP